MRPLLLLLVIGALGGVGCRAWPHRRAPDVTRDTLEALAADEGIPVGVKVENHNFLDVVIWLERDGMRTRLGQVGTARTGEFQLDSRLFRQGAVVRLTAIAIGTRGELQGANMGRANSVSTDRLSLVAGQYLVWTLESDLRRSSYGVFTTPAP